jgi:integrase
MRLDEITSDVIDGWLDKMIDDGYKNTTTNSYFGTLQTMLKWAAKKSMIEKDPFILVKKLIDDRAEREIITQDEFKALFADNWQTVWKNDLLRCTANKIAALTGLRCCEVLGLKGEFVFDTHIYLYAQHDKYGYRKTKTKVKHNIPLAPMVMKDLQELKTLNGDGYVFSLDGGVKPVSRIHIFNGLKGALNNIGISNAEMKKRGVNIHAWRHFCNTELQRGGLSIQEVQLVTGHKTLSSTERYTHLNPLEFSNVPRIQEELLKPSANNVEAIPVKPSLKLVKLTEPQQAAVS